MIAVDPEAVLELLDARDYYEQQRPGLGAVFELVAQRTLDAIEAAPDTYPNHPFDLLKPAPPRLAELLRLLEQWRDAVIAYDEAASAA